MIYTLAPSERNQLLEVAETCYAIRTMSDFDAWISGPVKAYFPHDMMVGALGRMVGAAIRIERLVGVNCSDSHLERFSKIADFASCQAVRRWLSEYRAQIIDDGEFATRLSPSEREEMSSLGLSNFAGYGLLDIAGGGGSYFCFSKIPGALTPRHGYLLELLVPYLHQALTRISYESALRPEPVESDFEQLTKREREILLLVATGMSNRAIARSLCRSEQTIQNHVHAILRKIGVPNRTAAAVWIACGNGHYPPSRTRVPLDQCL